MQCSELKEYVLTRDAAGSLLAGAAETHVSGCPTCASLASRYLRVDALMRQAAVVEPPLDLQARLQSMALAAAVVEPEPAVASVQAPVTQRVWRWPSWSLNPSWLPRTNAGLAQAVALLLVSLATWQVYQLVLSASPVLGSPLYALELVVSSPAVLYLGGFTADLQSVVQWSIMALFVWAFADRRSRTHRPLSDVSARH